MSSKTQNPCEWQVDVHTVKSEFLISMTDDSIERGWNANFFHVRMRQSLSILQILQIESSLMTTNTPSEDDISNFHYFVKKQSKFLFIFLYLN